ncbi:hypothetical protein RsS62_64630 [Rhizobium dioscoreae]|nr:hypothetical protein RsS62_64630 [Rhizobium dioscoreae]
MTGYYNPRTIRRSIVALVSPEKEVRITDLYQRVPIPEINHLARATARKGDRCRPVKAKGKFHD